MKTRLMIVDDHEVVRMGLRAALEVEPDFAVVAEAGNGREAIEKARAHAPELVGMHERPGNEDNLTAREREVLALIADGATNKEIAAKLVVSDNTARNHVSHILGKLGFTRRSEAAAYAVRKGIVRG